jgi:hypothetical protein
MRFRKRGINDLLAGQGYNHLQKRVGIALIILIVALITYSSWFLFFYAKPVDSSQEFVDAMSNCRDVSWVKEDAQASWLYKIKGGSKGDTCEVEIRLLQMKEGTIEADKLQGTKMICTVQKGETQFPEKDISKCTGVLKEELQDIIIQRMHNYLLQNVGEIKEEFQQV